MKRTGQSGFTLIELIVVIVILGILAATALPRFVNLQGDARFAKAQAILGGLKSAAALAHAEALITGQTGASGSITMEGFTITLAYGYPVATAAADGILGAAQLTATGDGINPTVSGNTLNLDINGASTAANCRVVYTQATAANPAPAIALSGTTTGASSCL